MGLVQTTLYSIGCLPSVPRRHCVKGEKPGGKASLVIGSRKNVLEAERNVLLFSRPFFRATQIAHRMGGAIQSSKPSLLHNH